MLTAFGLRGVEKRQDEIGSRHQRKDDPCAKPEGLITPQRARRYHFYDSGQNDQNYAH
jgi:hypothetical protein